MHAPVFAVAASLASASMGAVVTLDFDTLPDQVPVGLQYGPDFNFIDGYCGIDYDVTSSSFQLPGDTANEPSKDGTLYFPGMTSGTFTIDVLPGFTFWSTMYSSLVNVQVDAWSLPGGAGSNLGTTTLPWVNQVNSGDPTGTYNTWLPWSLNVAGVAYSITFTSVPWEHRYDDMGFNILPAPGVLALFGAALPICRRRR